MENVAGAGDHIHIVWWKQWLDPKNVSAIYVFIVLFGIFSLWIPDLFLTKTTWRTLLDNQVVTSLSAMALVIPLAAGVVNLAVGAQVGAASIFIGWLLVKQGMNPALAAVVCTAFGCAIGFATGLLLVYARINSFIGTLGVSSLLAAFITAISGGHQILGMPDSFADLGTNELFGITYPVYFVLIVALGLWYLLERTPAGRRIYATGGNIEAARLSGVQTARVHYRIARAVRTDHLICGNARHGTVSQCGPYNRARVSLTSVHRGVLWLHTVQRWKIQHLWNAVGRVRACNRCQRPSARWRTRVVSRCVQRSCAADRRSARQTPKRPRQNKGNRAVNPWLCVPLKG